MYFLYGARTICPLWKPNLHYQDAMPLEPLAAYSCNVYMYIIMGWFSIYHLCFDVLCYFFTEPTKQVHDFISQYDHIIAKSLSNYNSFIHSCTDNDRFVLRDTLATI